jgi:hypothetical protein
MMFHDSDRTTNDQHGMQHKSGRTNSSTPVKVRFSRQQIQAFLLNKDMRLGDNPRDVRLAQLAANLPEDAVLQDLLGLVIDKKTTEAITAINSDPWWPNYPALGSIHPKPDDIIVGVMPNGDLITLGQLRMFCNIGVFGRTGSSKTSWINCIMKDLIKKGILIIVFQYKSEYEDWATDPELAGKVLPLQFGEFMISRFQPPPGVPKSVHLDTNISDTAACTGRVYSQRLGHDIAEKEEKKLPKNYHLPLMRFIQVTEAFKPGFGDVERNYRESILYALKNIQASFKGVYDYYYSDFLDKLYKVFPDGGLVTVTLDAPVAASTDAILSTVRYIYSLRKYSGLQTEDFQPLIIIIEDGTMIIDEKSLHGEPSPLIPMSFISRKWGIGFIIVSHNIATSVSPLLLANLESVFLFGLSDEDPKRIQKLLGCSYEQAQTAQTFAPGSFAARIPSFHGLPVFGRFPEIKPPRKLTEQERLEIVTPFLRSVKAIKYIDLQLPATGQSSVGRNEIKDVYNLSPIEVKFLIIAGTCWWYTKTKLYDACGLNRRTGKKVSDQLEKKGLIVTHCIGKNSFVEVTELGWTVLNDKGIEKPKSRTNGNFEHELSVKLIEAYENAQGRITTFEINFFNRRLDMGALDKSSGHNRYYNIGVSDPIRETAALADIAKLPVMKNNDLVFVARDLKFAEQVKKAIKKEDTSSQLLTKVTIKTIADFVSNSHSD